MKANTQYVINLLNHHARYGQIGIVADVDESHYMIRWLITTDGKEISEEQLVAKSAFIKKEADKSTIMKARFGGAHYIVLFKENSVEFPTDIKVKVSQLLADYKPKMSKEEREALKGKKDAKPQKSEGATEVAATDSASTDKYRGIYVGMIVGNCKSDSNRYGYKGKVLKLDRKGKKIQVQWTVNKFGHRINEKATYKIGGFHKPVDTNVILTPHSTFQVQPYKTSNINDVCFVTQTDDQGKDCGEYLIRFYNDHDILETEVMKDVTREQAINRGRELCSPGTVAQVFKINQVAEISYLPQVKQF